MSSYKQVLHIGVGDVGTYHGDKYEVVKVDYNFSSGEVRLDIKSLEGNILVCDLDARLFCVAIDIPEELKNYIRQEILNAIKEADRNRHFG